MPKPNLPIVMASEENILEKIYVIRGQKVMLDRDLAEMYGVRTFRLNEAVKRNKDFRKILCFSLLKMNGET